MGNQTTDSSTFEPTHEPSEDDDPIFQDDDLDLDPISFDIGEEMDVILNGSNQRGPDGGSPGYSDEFNPVVDGTFVRE